MRFRVSAEKEAPEFIDLLLWVTEASLKRWKLLLTTSLIAVVCSVVFVLFIADEEFESVAIITPPASTDGLSALEGLADDLGPISGILGMGLGASGETELILTMLSNTELHETLIQAFALDSLYEFRKNPPKKYFKADLLKEFRKKFGASEDDETGFILISMRDESAIRAKDIVNKAITVLDSTYIQLKSKQAQRMREFYEQRLNRNKLTLDSLKQSMVVFQNKTKILDPAVQLEESYKGYAALEAQKEAIEIELEAERELHGKGTLLEKKLEQRSVAMGQSLSRLRMEGSKSGALVSLKNISSLSREYFDLYEEIKVQEAIHLYLRKLYEQAVLKEANDVQSFDVLEKPWVNEKRVSPPRRAVVVGLTLATFVLTLLWCAFLEMYFSEKERNGPRYLKIRRILALFGR